MKTHGGGLHQRITEAGLIDEVMERFRAGGTLIEISKWLTDQGVEANVTALHRFKRAHYDDYLMTKAGIEINPEDTTDINLETIKRLAVIFNREVRGLSGMADVNRFVGAFARYHEILMSRKADMRAEHDAKRKLAMRIIDLLDNDERLQKAKDTSDEAKAEGLEARIAALSEHIWPGIWDKAA